MITPSMQFTETRLGTLRVRRFGSGLAAVLWHSLFIDSTSWGPICEALGTDRTVIAVDGPSHGGSQAIHRDFGFDEVCAAALEVLDQLGIAGPVDWVGNAWGGHLGILLAAHHPERIRTLTTIGTPVQSLSFAERWGKVGALVALYRLLGPQRYLVSALSDALLGPEAVAEEPDRASAILGAFCSADRDGMYHAMRSMMLRRPDLHEELTRVRAPTLMIAARDDAMGWQLPDAERACATMRDARAVAVGGTGHVSPLLLDGDRIVRIVREHWDTGA